MEMPKIEAWFVVYDWNQKPITLSLIGEQHPHNGDIFIFEAYIAELYGGWGQMNRDEISLTPGAALLQAANDLAGEIIELSDQLVTAKKRLRKVRALLRKQEAEEVGRQG